MFERRRRLRRAASGGTMLGAGAGALLALLELSWRYETFAQAFLSAWDTLLFAIYAWAVLVLSGALLGGLLGLVAVAVARMAERFSRRPRAIRANKVRLYALLATPAAAWLLSGLLTGRRARQIPQRDLWAVVAGMVLIAVLAWVCRAVLVAKEEIGRGATRPSHGMLTGLGVLLGSAVLYAVDQTLWPRLYPTFHAALAFSSFVACMFGLAAFYQTFRLDSTMVRRIARPRRAWALFLTFGAAGFASLTQFARHQPMRALAFEHTSFLAYALRGASKVRLLGSTTSQTQVRSLRWNDQPGDAIEGPTFPQRDIFLITIDALRADHLGAYGYPRVVSPALDALAQESVVFERAYAQVPHTSFSLASLHCSRYVYALAALGDSRKCQTMADVLRREGWATAAFFPPAIFYIEPERFAAYEKSRFGFEHVRYENLEAEPRVDQIISYLDKQKTGRVFVWAHFFEPHEPYDVHSSLEHGYFGKEAVDRYDGEIAWLDRSLDRLFKYIRKKRPQAIIIVTADHGEEFGEHGGRYHGTSLYDEQVRVPLFFSIPGLPPARIGPAVELIDVFPSVLGFLELDPPSNSSGTNLGPWIAASASQRASMPPAFFELEARKAVVQGSHKLICDMTYGFCELFDLKADPRERRNVVSEQPQMEQKLRGLLAAWMDDRSSELQSASLSNDEQKWRRPIEHAKMGDREAVIGLAELLLHPNKEIRDQAAQLIVGFPADPRIRQTVQKAVAKDGGSEWVQLVMAAFCDEKALGFIGGLAPKDATFGARAGLILEGCRHPKAGNLLIAGLPAKDMALRRQVILAIGRRKDPAALPALMPYLEGVLERNEVVAAFGMIGDASTIPALAERLAVDPYATVRAESARALGVMCSDAAKDALRKRLHATNTMTPTAAPQGSSKPGAKGPPMAAPGSAAAEPAQGKPDGLPDDPDDGEEDGTVVSAIVGALWKCGALDGAVRGGTGKIMAKRGLLWVGRTPGSRESIVLVSPKTVGNVSNVRALPEKKLTTQSQATPSGDVELFEIPPGTWQVQVKGPAAFLYAK